MKILITRDVEEFAARAEEFLAEKAERNVLATVLDHVLRGRSTTDRSLFAIGLDARGAVCAAALRTPPWPMLACELEGLLADELMELWLAEDAAVPGVSGQPVTAHAIAASWTRLTGKSSHLSMREAMHSLVEVADPPRPAAGRLRGATNAEQDLLIEWEQAFLTEARVGVPAEASRTVAMRLASRAQYVWDDEGAVSTLALSPAIAGNVRIGPVYTPPAHRRRGYASSAVAAVARQALASGVQRCMLFTDLANTTSNKIYAAIGFRRFADWEEHGFCGRSGRVG